MPASTVRPSTSTSTASPCSPSTPRPTAPLALDYGAGTVVKSGGGIITVDLKVPGVKLPAQIRLILMVDTVGVAAGIVQ